MSIDSLDGEHPFILELSSLRNAVNHYQRETYNVSLTLQRHALESANVIQQLQATRYENAYLRKELEVYRAITSGGNYKEDARESIRVQELTLALRRLSDKLDLAEQAIMTCKEELAITCKDRDIARQSTDLAYATAVRLRGELESCRAGERDLLSRVRAAEEERRMSDLVVEEYAHLVRSLEGRSTSQQVDFEEKEDGHTSRESLDGLSTARAGLQKLLIESNSECQSFQNEIARLYTALENTQMTLESERKVAADERRKFAMTELELHRLRADDNAAAKMVSRYMKFSQSSTDILHKAIETMKVKHVATVNSFESRIQQAEDTMQAEQRQCDRLRQALDELTENISRESYGRRREIALRLALVGREERLSERLKRWLLKAQEELHNSTPSDPPDVLHAKFASTLRAADSLARIVAGNRSTGVSSIDEHREQKSGIAIDSFARILSAQSAVAALNSELQKETDRRLFLERQFARLHPDALQPRELVDESVSAHLSDDWNGCDLVHAGDWHQHTEKKLCVSSRSHIREVNNNAPSGSGRSPEESPNQAKLLDIPLVETHHSHEDLSAGILTTPPELSDAGKASIAPYSGRLIRLDDSTSSVVFPGVSPINDNGLAEPSAPERKAVIPEDDSTESTHDPDTAMMEDISQPSIAALQSETVPPPSLEEDILDRPSCSGSRNEAHAEQLGSVTMEAMVDQSLSHPSDTSLPEPSNSAHVKEFNAPRPEVHEDEVNVHDVTGPENNVSTAEPSFGELVQGSSSTTPALEEPPAEVNEGSDGLRLPAIGISVPVDVSENGITLTEKMNGANEAQGSDNIALANGSRASSNNENLSSSIPPQTERYRCQDVFPSYRIADSGNNAQGTGIEDMQQDAAMISSPHSVLLSRLNDVTCRYDDLQRSFRDCHVSLQQLKQESKELPHTSALYQAAVERLDDYCEDARVELEIRVADEERISRGYQTLLSVKGAFSNEVDEVDMRAKIDALLDGTDPAVRKALTSLQHKLDDLQHDIASVKQAMHDPSSLGPSPQASEAQETPKHPSSSWVAWTGSILSPSRSPSPAPPATFGTVMTTPRLRHSSSFIRNTADSNATQTSLANLGLRIAMPAQIKQPPTTTSVPQALSRGSPRPRVSSNMFGLGLAGGIIPGSRRTSMANVAVSISKSADFDDELD